VLHTIETTGPGGAETVFRELAARLDHRRFRAVVAVTGTGWLYDDLCAHGLQPRLLGGRGRAFSVDYLHSLVRVIRRERVDLVQSHLFGSSVYCALAGLLTRRPVIATLHGTVDVDRADRWLAAKLAAIKVGVARVVCVSDALERDILAATSLPPRQCMRIYNGIDMARYAHGAGTRLRRELGLDDDTILVVSVGNIRPAKGYEHLLAAAAMLRDRLPGRFHFAIAGQPDRAGLQEQLQAEHRRLGLEGVVSFLGYRADTLELLRGADLYALSSTTEGFPLAPLEAMAVGLPVVATRSGGPEELIRDGQTGLLVPPGQPLALADAIARLADDRRLRRDLAAAAREMVCERFSIESMVARYAELYETTLNGVRQRRWSRPSSARAARGRS